MALVTILLPTYNRAHFLPHAIESALSQSFTDIQLIILDDASPDDTPGAVRPFLEDTRVRYVRHGENKGITGNWRFGLELVDTEFFCLLEDDDIFGPDFVERMIKPLQNDRELILSFCDHWAIDAVGKRNHGLTSMMSRQFGRSQRQTGPVKDLAEAALITGSVGITATMFRSAFISSDFIRDEAAGGIDYWLLYQCVRTGRTAYYLSDRLMEYRLHGAGMSHSMPEMMARGHLFLYEEIVRDPNFVRLHEAARRKLHYTATCYGINLLTSHRPEEAVNLLAEALRYGFTARAYVAYRLALWEKGRVLAHSLRRIKQQAAQTVLPILFQYSVMNIGLLRLAKRLTHGIFFRH
ncbi:MAG: glycosyltransferase family 2 protein [Armatimonadota bacterium]